MRVARRSRRSPYFNPGIDRSISARFGIEQSFCLRLRFFEFRFFVVLFFRRAFFCRSVAVLASSFRALGHPKLVPARRSRDLLAILCAIVFGSMSLFFDLFEGGIFFQFFDVVREIGFLFLDFLFFHSSSRRA